MGKDLRTFLNRLAESSDFLRVTKPVKAKFEITAVLQKLEEINRYPIVLFENVLAEDGTKYDYPVLTNLFASRERIASALDSTAETLVEDYTMREKRPLPPVQVAAGRAAVKEVIWRDKDVNLYKFPFVTHHSMDLGPYITAGNVWVKNLATGDINCGILRIWVSGPDRLVLNMNPAGHTYAIYQQYLEKKKTMPVVIVIGHHPAFYIGGQTKIPGNEVEIIGGIMDEPLEVTPSETWGEEVMVPAQAEMVIEGEIVPGELEVEGPFGEFTQYYGAQKLSNPVQVKAVTHRKDLIYLNVFAGHRDHLLMDVVQAEAALLSQLRRVCSGVKQVYLPPSGCCRFHAYIALKKRNDGEPRTVIASALASDFRVKHIVVVDEDVNIFNEEEVLWAVATRSQWDEDLILIPRMVGSRLDPSAKDILTCKGGIDATKPASPKGFSQKIAIPKEVLDQVKLTDFIDKDKLL